MAICTAPPWNVDRESVNLSFFFWGATTRLFSLSKIAQKLLTPLLLLSF
jgi:hypothetical protein